MDADQYGLLNTQLHIKSDLAELQKQIYNPLRFNELSVVTVDYEMPAMTGDIFCKKLAICHITNLMLTGLLIRILLLIS